MNFRMSCLLGKRDEERRNDTDSGHLVDEQRAGREAERLIEEMADREAEEANAKEAASEEPTAPETPETRLLANPGATSPSAMPKTMHSPTQTVRYLSNTPITA